MSYMLPHLDNDWQVDQAILLEEDRVFIIRFGHNWDPTCMNMDEVLCFNIKNFAVIYLVDIIEVPGFNKMYKLYDLCTVMFFRNKHIMIDLGTGNNIIWAMEDKKEMVDIINTMYLGTLKGRDLVVSLKDYSTKYRY
ncbi:thioredoxin-like protein 4A [Mus pahari]|uniref:thioredoxin-like protein 4A n=1 Tax=Mus pahari TaxID=10093 RepID=UPI000A30DDF3|nr:thioredoxin-like protein 4A [Mus pahari]